MPTKLLYVLAYLLCGVLTLLRYARHSWYFIARFVSASPILTVVAWPFVGMITAMDDDNPRNIFRHFRMDRLRDWLIAYGRRHAD